MGLRFRTAQAGDYQIAVHGLHGALGAYTVRERERDLPAFWRHISESGAGLATVAHDAATGALAAFRVSVFVSEAFAAQCVASAEPFPARRLLCDSDTRNAALLSRQEVARANRPGAGLRLLVLHSGATTPRINSRAFAELDGFHSGGFYLREVLLETLDDAGARWATDAGYRLANPYPDLPHDDSATRPVLFTATRSDYDAGSGYRVADLFAYAGVPRCGFGRGERELLLHALDGSDDETLAETLCVSLGTVRKRWHTIYDRFADCFGNFAAVNRNLIATNGGGVAANASATSSAICAGIPKSCARMTPRPSRTAERGGGSHWQ